MIDMHQVMAQVEKEVAAEGLPPEAAAHLRALGERLGPGAAGRAADRRLGGQSAASADVAAGPGARP